jgi:cephalosporin hydroxylase
MRFLKAIYRRIGAPVVNWLFFHHLLVETQNFGDTKWMGAPIWQNVLDLWNIQEALCEIRPELLIECGTNRGGSALYYAHLMELLGQGRVVSIDVEKMHSIAHPRATFITGSSVSEPVVRTIEKTVNGASGPVFVILDSDHSESHVYEELVEYSRFVTPGSYCLVQDGVIDKLHMFRKVRPGPLPAIRRFLKEHGDFAIDTARERRFLITSHPMGWLRRKDRDASTASAIQSMRESREAR